MSASPLASENLKENVWVAVFTSAGVALTNTGAAVPAIVHVPSCRHPESWPAVSDVRA